MSLAKRFKEAPEPKTGKPCSVGEVLNKLEGEELEALVRALGTPEKRGQSAAVIHNALVAENHRVSFQQINRHRGGTCGCAL